VNLLLSCYNLKGRRASFDDCVAQYWVSKARAMAEKPKLNFEACRQITQLITQS